jgi:hypothetical protein
MDHETEKEPSQVDRLLLIIVVVIVICSFCIIAVKLVLGLPVLDLHPMIHGVGDHDPQVYHWSG